MALRRGTSRANHLLRNLRMRSTPRSAPLVWDKHARNPTKAGCDFIVTNNRQDFTGVEAFGIRAVTAKEFLPEIGELP